MDLRLNWDQLSKMQKVQLYTNYLAVPLNKEAIFSDSTGFFCMPQEPKPFEDVRIRCRAERDNIDGMFFCYGENRIEMFHAFDEVYFSYYETLFQMPAEKVSYYFEIHLGTSIFYYNHEGVRDVIQERYNFKLFPGFSTPDWAKGAVIYQIYVDRFYNGDKSNDVVDDEYIYIKKPVNKVKDWYAYPASMGVREFYGGDLLGVKKKLNYLQELGVEVIYFNPLFVSPSNHKYDIQDYDYIDPHFGVIVRDEGEPLKDESRGNAYATKYISRVTDKENLEASNQFFIEFVEEIHKRGMKVILDGVFNHCGSFNKWLDREHLYEQNKSYEKGAYIDKNSPYQTFFNFREDRWPYNETYDGWWGHSTLPKLNYEESPLLYEYIMKIAKKWVSPPYNVDGWRLDVAADLGHSNEYNHRFWKEFRKVVKEANPEAIILAEHYGDPESWLQGDEWDTIMNYDAFMEPLTWFLTGMEKHSDEYRSDLLGNADAFFGAMRENMIKFSTPSLQVAMNELSNHDHSRFLTRTNHMAGRTASCGPEAAEQGINKAIFRAAVLVQMTWSGAPTVYYGDEAGLCGWTDPDNRRTYPWGKEDKEMIAFHKEVIRIHKDYQALKTGSILFLKGENHFISYGRFDENDKLVVAVNSSDAEKTVKIQVWKIGLIDGARMARMIMSTEQGYNMQTAIIPVERGQLSVTLAPYTAAVYKDVKIF